MYPSPSLTELLAREHTRERIREAEVRRTARAIRARAVERRYVVQAGAPEPPRRRRTWWFVPGRTTTA